MGMRPYMLQPTQPDAPEVFEGSEGYHQEVGRKNALWGAQDSADGQSIWPRYTDMLAQAQQLADHYPSDTRVMDTLACLEGFTVHGPVPGKPARIQAQLKPYDRILSALGAPENAQPAIKTLLMENRLYESSCMMTLPPLRFWVKTGEALLTPQQTWANPYAATPLNLPDTLTSAACNFHVIRHEAWHGIVPVAQMESLGYPNQRRLLTDNLLDHVLAAEQHVTERMRRHGINLNEAVAADRHGGTTLVHRNLLDKLHCHYGETIADCGALFDMAYHELMMTGQLTQTPALVDAYHDVRALNHTRDLLTADAATLVDRKRMGYATHMAMPYLRVRLHELAQPNPSTGRAKLLELDAEAYRQEVIDCASQALHPHEFADMLVGARWLQSQFRHEFITLCPPVDEQIGIGRTMLARTTELPDDVQATTDEMLAKGETALQRLSGGRKGHAADYAASVRERMAFVGPEHEHLLASLEISRLELGLHTLPPDGPKRDAILGQLAVLKDLVGVREAEGR